MKYYSGQNHIQIWATQHRKRCTTISLNRKDDSREDLSGISKPLEALLCLEERAETFPKEVCHREIASGSVVQLNWLHGLVFFLVGWVFLLFVCLFFPMSLLNGYVSRDYVKFASFDYVELRYFH